MAIAEERDASNTVTARYFEQGFQRIQSSPSSTQNYFTSRDHLGSIREVTNQSAAVLAAYDYDPYGRQEKAMPTGMALWLKADAGVTKDGNNKVSVWTDQSGNGNDAT